MTSINRFSGLQTNADPIDVGSSGGAVAQHNCHPRKAGMLTARRGINPATFAGDVVLGRLNDTDDVIALYSTYNSDGQRIPFLTSGGNVLLGDRPSATDPEDGIASTVRGFLLEENVDTDALSCWAQARTSEIVRVNGVARGTFWRGEDTDEVLKLGITAPVAAPTMTVAAIGDVSEGSDSGDPVVTYYCAYRYVDDGGTPSSISPIAEVTATIDPDELFPTLQFNWSNIDAPPSSELKVTKTSENRVSKIEYWRSTTDQADVLYLVGSEDAGTGMVPRGPNPNDIFEQGKESLSDDTLLTAAADLATVLPILFADRSLSARRFVPPPEDLEVVVAYRDRFVYAVPAVPGDDNRSLYISHPNEPESVPPSQNVFFLQPDGDDNDQITSLVPWGQVLWVFMQRHAHVFSYAADPRYDASSRSIYPRGALNQRCHATLGDAIYLLDEQGCWRMTSQGYEAIDQPIADLFRDATIDFSKADAFFVSAEPHEQIIRFHVCYSGDGTRPTRTLAYHVPTRSWSTETYPVMLAGSCRTVADNQASTLVGGEDGYIFLLDQGTLDKTAWGSSNESAIDWSFRTGMLPIPPAEKEGGGDEVRNIWLTYQPTAGEETLNLAIYYDRETLANLFSTPRTEGALSAVSGNRYALVDMELAHDTAAFGNTTGVVRLPLAHRQSRTTLSKRFISLEVSGSQQDEEHTIQSVEVE